MRVIVVGARGQLGAAVVHEFAADHEVVSLARRDLDINDAAAVQALTARLAPDVVVNCAGYNAVDAAEDHPVEALRTNALAVRNLARAATAANTVLVHCSTDFVFDGSVARPHVEDDRPNPRSVYAASKLIGEWFASDVPRGYVLRVESLFGRAPEGPPAKGSAETILAALRRGDAPRVFEDRTVSPTYVIDAARAMRALVERAVPAGLYHCVNSGSCSWLEFAVEAARVMQVEPNVERVRTEDVPMRAERPKYCALSNARLAAAGIPMPDWRDALQRYLDAVRDDRADQAANRQA
jgi:dTDP-4-dehydrorhamnose reductase